MQGLTRLLLILFGMQALPLFAQNTSIANIDERVEALLQKMTLDEKIGQLNQLPGDISTGTDVGSNDLLNQIKEGKIGSILSHTNFENKRIMQKAAVKQSRLGIPLLFGFDVIHGYKTIFPIPLAQAASWDLEAIENAERIAAAEAAADGQHWAFAPMVDISRDPRWGRVMEGSGEDTYLGARIAEARVRGFQGSDLANPLSVAACTKHFAGYGFTEGGRDYNTVDMSEQRLRNIVLPPFKAAADAGSATFMNAFNILNGTPATMNRHLQEDILRNEWGWDGMMVSDWNSVGETIIHGAAADDADASAKCLTAGCDMDMSGGTYTRGMKAALKAGTVTQEQIDQAVRRVLRLKFQLGLFDDPYRYLDEARREATLEKPEHRAAARELAANSMVLLKNDGGLLPLKADGPFKKIAIIGPYANSQGNKDYMSFWTLGIGARAYDSTKVVTPAMALKPALEEMGFEVTVTEVCMDPTCTEKEYMAARNAAKEADLIICCVGERGINCGESRSVSNIELEEKQQTLLRIVSRGNTPVVMALFNSRPLVFEWAAENTPAILVAWQAGFETGNALADVLTGKVNPSGKLPITFPRNLGQVPLYYNAMRTGRPQTQAGQMWTSGYLDSSTEPQWPFGFGLSYTKFSYSDLQISKEDKQVRVSITVANTGGMAGEEVVQLYIHDPVADIARPVKELKGFEKIMLQAGEKKQVQFVLTEKELGYWNGENQFKADKGRFDVFVGGSSVDVLQGNFTW
ncbi:MAG: beta-glucosidase BglX [Saprospiraceae bacterium]